MSFSEWIKNFEISRLGVRRRGDTTTGELIVERADAGIGAVTETFRSNATGTYTSGLAFGQIDLTVIVPAYGKIPKINAYSNSALVGDDIMGFPKNSYFTSPDGTDCVFAALRLTDYASMTLTASWDEPRWEFGSDLYVNGSLSFQGNLTLADSANIVMGSNSQLQFPGGSYITEVWDGSGNDIKIYSRNTSASIGYGNGALTLISAPAAYFDCKTGTAANNPIYNAIPHSYFRLGATSGNDITALSVTSYGLNCESSAHLAMFCGKGITNKQLTGTWSSSGVGYRTITGDTGQAHGLVAGDIVRLVPWEGYYEVKTVASVSSPSVFVVNSDTSSWTGIVVCEDYPLVNLADGLDNTKFSIDKRGNTILYSNLLVSGTVSFEGNLNVLGNISGNITDTSFGDITTSSITDSGNLVVSGTIFSQQIENTALHSNQVVIGDVVDGSSALQVLGEAKINGNITFSDGASLYLNSAQTSSVSYDGYNVYINSYDSGYGGLPVVFNCSSVDMGSAVSSVLTNVLTNTGILTTTGQFQTGNGTAAAPSHSFTNDTNIGLYRIGVDNLGISVGGRRLVGISGTTFAVSGTITSTLGAAIPSLTVGGVSKLTSTVAISGTTFAQQIECTGINVQANNLNVATVTSGTTTLGSHSVLLTSGTTDITFTLPSSVSGRTYYIKKIDNSLSSVYIFPPSGQTIDGQSYEQFNTQYACMQVISDGNNWWII